MTEFFEAENCGGVCRRRAVVGPHAMPGCQIFLLLVFLAAFAPVRVFATDAPNLRSLLKEARLVVAGSVTGLTLHDNGRLAVGALGVSKVLKGAGRQRGDQPLAVIESRDLPTPAKLKANTRVLAFLKPAPRTSYLAKTLPAGTYYELVRHHSPCLVAESDTELVEMTALVERVLAASQKPDPDRSRRAKAAREITFRLLAARHPLLVEDGAAGLAGTAHLAASLQEDEQHRLEAALARDDLPARVRVALIRAVAASGLKQVAPVLQTLRSPAEVQEAAWEALDRLGTPPPAKRIEEQLVAEEASVRAAAVRELLRREGTAAVSKAAPVALQDRDQSVRLAAVVALGDLKKEEALPPLERVFAAESGELQQAAGRAIIAIGGQAAADTFGRLAFNGPPEAQRYAVVLLMVMGRGKDDPLVDRIAKTHPDDSIRRMIEHGFDVEHH